MNVLAKAAITLAGVFFMNAHLGAADALKAHRWEHRLLLIFSPRADDLRVRRLDEHLAARACELTERDLVVGHFPGSGDARLGNDVLAPESAAWLRAKYKVDPGEFAVILVGKDGYEKRRDGKVPNLDALFEQIDGMPMRRAEMNARAAGCPG